MGFWSSDKPSPPAPKISSDGAPIAPDRSQRAKCWEARDAYFRCLDKNEIVDSLSEKDKVEKACAAEGKGFESNCALSWVSCSPGKPSREKARRRRKLARLWIETRMGFETCNDNG
jgi:cytochrome c oxidase assembly factor 6